MQGHLSKIEGAFTGFKNNLDSAFQMNKESKNEISSNSKMHDNMKAIAFGIAQDALNILGETKKAYGT